MELYNELIRSTLSRLPETVRRWDYSPAAAWEDAGGSELVLLRDAAYELGGGGRDAVHYTCVTSSRDLVERDEVLLWGPDLGELRADGPYARIALLRVGDIESDDGDDTAAYNAVKDMEFVKYHVFPRGYMLRVSTESHREQVRVSRQAVGRGISFQAVGCDFIRRYRENPQVLAVKLIFITAPEAPYAALTDCARRAAGVTRALCGILEGLPTDCSACHLKPICDEVEGMRELHFGQGGMGSRQQQKYSNPRK